MNQVPEGGYDRLSSCSTSQLQSARRPRALRDSQPPKAAAQIDLGHLHTGTEIAIVEEGVHASSSELAVDILCLPMCRLPDRQEISGEWGHRVAHDHEPSSELRSLDDGPLRLDTESCPLEQPAIAGDGHRLVPIVGFKCPEAGSADSRDGDALNDGQLGRVPATGAIEEQPDVDELSVRVDAELVGAAEALRSATARTVLEDAERFGRRFN